MVSHACFVVWLKLNAPTLQGDSECMALACWRLRRRRAPRSPPLLNLPPAPHIATPNILRNCISNVGACRNHVSDCCFLVTFRRSCAQIFHGVPWTTFSYSCPVVTDNETSLPTQGGGGFAAALVSGVIVLSIHMTNNVLRPNLSAVIAEMLPLCNELDQFVSEIAEMLPLCNELGQPIGQPKVEGKLSGSCRKLCRKCAAHQEIYLGIFVHMCIYQNRQLFIPTVVTESGLEWGQQQQVSP